jgi:hypothetical protein
MNEEFWNYLNHQVDNFALDFIENFLRYESVRAQWASVVSILHSPWWKRCWVVQELVGA